MSSDASMEVARHLLLHAPKGSMCAGGFALSQYLAKKGEPSFESGDIDIFVPGSCDDNFLVDAVSDVGDVREYHEMVDDALLEDIRSTILCAFGVRDEKVASYQPGQRHEPEDPHSFEFSVTYDGVGGRFYDRDIMCNLQEIMRNKVPVNPRPSNLFVVWTARFLLKGSKVNVICAEWEGDLLWNFDLSACQVELKFDGSGLPTFCAFSEDVWEDIDARMMRLTPTAFQPHHTKAYADAMFTPDAIMRVYRKDLEVLGPRSQLHAEVQLVARRVKKYTERGLRLVGPSGAGDPWVKLFVQLQIKRDIEREFMPGARGTKRRIERSF